MRFSEVGSQLMAGLASIIASIPFWFWPVAIAVWIATALARRTRGARLELKRGGV